MFILENHALYEIKSLQNDIFREFCKTENKEFLFPVHFKIIEYLIEHNSEDIYQKDLEGLLNIRKSTLSTIIHTMERNDLITRVASKKDARNKKLVLTKKALIKLEDMKVLFDKIESNILKDVPDDKLDVFYEVIGMMRSNLNRNKIEKRVIVNDKDV